MRNNLKYSKDKKGNKDDEELVGNQEGLRLEIMKMEKPEVGR